MGPPPPNAYPPGTALTVGSHAAVITKYISEGGFAHVYTVEINPPYNGCNIACLKRVAVPDKVHLNILRAEVDAMKRLKGNKHVVSYIDSHAARLNSNSNKQAYEVLLLMEYCSRNGLIDFMNTRLTNKLTEPEILQIMGEVTEGVANSHYLTPPLIHRDIKIENVLINGDGTYKLCDFGSASPILRPPRNSDEFTILQQDILQHTTAQYRSPEMIDLYRGFPIDGKSDIWALGVFLYKLCYYITPFEREGEMAILSAKFSFPHSPQFSVRLKNVIAVCLKEDPRKRPTIYQLLEEICKMRGLPMPNVIPPGATSSGVIHAEKQGKQETLSLPTRQGNGSSAIIAAINKPVVTKINGTSKSSEPSSSSSSYNSDKDVKDPFATIDKSKLISTNIRPTSPTKIERPKSQSFERHYELSKKFSKIALDSSNNKVVRGNHETTAYAPSSINLHSKSVPNLDKMGKKRPMSLYNKPESAQTPQKDFKSLKTIINGISESANIIELSPGQNHIDNNVDFLNYLEKQDSGASWKHQNTGGSSVSIRNISTGSNRLKRGSISSIKQLVTGENKAKSQPSSRQPSSNLVRPEEFDYNGGPSLYSVLSTPVQSKALPARQKQSRTSSIQRRVHMLLNKSNEKAQVKTARGYGKYTEEYSKNTVPDSVKEIKRPQQLQKQRTFPISNLTIDPKTPPLSKDSTGLSNGNSARTSSNGKKPPPKPKKPLFLKSPKKESVVSSLIPHHKRQVSAMSEFSLVDVDDLEKDFNQRFPSAV